jgi:FdhD protein
MREASHMVVQPAARGLEPVADAPRLSAAVCDMLREVEIIDEFGERRSIDVPAERPLTVVVDGRELVTLMTLGASPELLVLGYLHNQRLIRDVTSVESIEVDWKLGTARVTSRARARPIIAAKTGSNVPSTGCGLGSALGGWVSQVDALQRAATNTARLGQGLLYRLLEIMSEQESLHRGAGSVHGCALFRAAEMLVFVEDVGRHNAIDTLIGWMALHGVAGGDKILYTTGRLSAEMVMKAAQIGLLTVVSRNGATAMGLEVGSKLGMTLIGRAAKRRFLCYVGAERFASEPEPRGLASRAVEK